MMNKKTSLVLLFLAFLTQAGCGSPSSSGGGDNGGADGSGDIIDIPDGYALYGTVDDNDIRVLDADAGGSVTVSDSNNNNIWDSTESISLGVRNPDAYGSSTEVYIVVIFTPGVGHSFSTGTLYDISSGAVYLMTDGSHYTTYNIDTGSIIFSSFGTQEEDTISWKFEVTLENNAGELNGKFSDQLQIEEDGPSPD